MSTTQVHSSEESRTASVLRSDMKLEVVVIPVSDVERAKQFYGSLGWRLDVDVASGDDFRLVQYTPKGSGCSVQFGTHVTPATPGSAQATYLIVPDIEAAREELTERGVGPSEVFHCGSGFACRFPGNDGRVTGVHAQRGSYASFLSFGDPDGNSWLVQEVTTRAPGRVDGDTAYKSAAELSQALRRAAAAHGEHEARTGQADANWPDWYAEYMVREQAGEEPPL
jgi:catechol 2,3-dioxygenase-like lactoylglutathione lyase family enzyme